MKFWGDGAVKVDGGAGNDAIYVGQNGADHNAVWVMNSNADHWGHLQRSHEGRSVP